MRRGGRSVVRRALAPLLVALAGACTIGRVGVTDLTARPPVDGTRTDAHVRVHLADGSTVVFRHGVRFERALVRGRGEHWPLGAFTPVLVRGVAMDSVIAIEAFHRHIDKGKTAIANIPAAYLLIGSMWAGAALRGSKGGF